MHQSGLLLLQGMLSKRSAAAAVDVRGHSPRSVPKVESYTRGTHRCRRYCQRGRPLLTRTRCQRPHSHMCMHACIKEAYSYICDTRGCRRCRGFTGIQFSVSWHSAGREVGFGLPCSYRGCLCCTLWAQRPGAAMRWAWNVYTRKPSRDRGHMAPRGLY